MTDQDQDHGLPDKVGAGLAPGGLVAVLVVNGQIVDYTPLTTETTDVEGVAVRHATAALYAADAGKTNVVGIYDGDTGEVMAVMGVSAP
jgi:hypothetical protein